VVYWAAEIEPMSDRIRILNVEPDGFSPRARSILEQVGELTEVNLSRSELLARLADYEVLIVRFRHKIDRAMIDAGRRLKVIVTAATGVDHIDTDYATARGIEVLSLRGEYEFLESVSASAEHSWALLLALMRRIPQAFASVRSGEWDRDRFRGHDLCDKRLAILGLGRVGRKVAAYGRAFGMHVAAYDPNAQCWVPGVERRNSIADLFGGRDVISIHVSLIPDTIKLVRREHLSLLSSGSVLINTARGEVVDEAALLESLEAGHLAGAAVDVISGENTNGGVAENRLIAYARAHDNLLITPHIGGATYESMAKTEVFMASKLARFVKAKMSVANI